MDRMKRVGGMKKWISGLVFGSTFAAANADRDASCEKHAW
jgi:hypothetical protein